MYLCGLVFIYVIFNRLKAQNWHAHGKSET
jgi:phenylpyruvate tautomerase PptA (4-oxalocrotonate tautomerase family)